MRTLECQAGTGEAGGKASAPRRARGMLQPPSQRSPSALTTSTQLAAASSAAAGGLANEILIPRRKRLTPLISHRVKPNPNTRRGAGGRPWQRCRQGAAAAHPAGASPGARRRELFTEESPGWGIRYFYTLP